MLLSGVPLSLTRIHVHILAHILSTITILARIHVSLFAIPATIITPILGQTAVANHTTVPAFISVEI